ncbi:TetR/AcrR family transcriptional regulator [Paramicrobacterium agarici]|uniref:TetR family transcriptional regulator n=1 Tax=Paramicrobacterium agarici TaxID=630514 RepID=A0A2A9DSK9_9MICO|nr:TetR/AcrR family transcriptional regulator [Microbacterium agarici]PFG29668.1 TetR family transcriptional regulator [Microbacterium agarici]TQO22691.1 TetR family transcriptional regulator [Microbacterium agarici]
MAHPSRATREYRSAVREQRAAQTRAAILDAARQLFRSGGFAATTVNAIAERAGVSAPTVYATFGSKASVARAIVEQIEESSRAAHWRNRIAHESDPHVILHAFAQWTAEFFSASIPELTLASELTAEASTMVAEGNARRRDALTALVGRLADHAALRPGLSQREAVDRVWMLTGIEMYVNAVQGCGWPIAHYVSWLSETLAQQILDRGATS